MSRFYLSQFRFCLEAYFFGKGTAFGKPAFISRIDGGCDLTVDDLPLLIAAAELWHRDGGQQSPCVGMGRMGK